MLRGELHRARAEEWDAITGSAADDERAIERLVGNVRDIHHHAQAIHLVNNILAEVAEPVFGVGNCGVVDIAGRIGPTVGVRPGKGHVTHAEAVVIAQQAKAVLNGVAAFDPMSAASLCSRWAARISSGEKGHAHLLRVLGCLLVDGVDSAPGCGAHSWPV